MRFTIYSVKLLTGLVFLWAAVLTVPVTGLPAEIPPLTGRIVDRADLLSPSEISRLETKLRHYEDRTSNQIAVLTIPSLDGDPLEDYSMRVAEAWKLGQADKNNGVLILITKEERQVRIEVGYGLEGALSDAISSYIIRNDLIPAFRSGNYYNGLNNAVNSIIQVTAGEFKADPGEEKSGEATGIGDMIFHVIFILFMMSFLGFGRRRGWGWAGFGAGYWMGSFGRRRGGGFGGGGFGGFSGGGGGFGGGGASGSW